MNERLIRFLVKHDKEWLLQEGTPHDVFLLGFAECLLEELNLGQAEGQPWPHDIGQEV